MVLLLKSDCVQPMAFSTFVPSVAKQMGGGGKGGGPLSAAPLQVTGVAISLANVFLLHQ